MSVRCENCGKIVQPLFELDGGIDCFICPECGCTIDACTVLFMTVGPESSHSIIVITIGTTHARKVPEN